MGTEASYLEAKKKSAALFDENAGSKKARVTREQPPSNPEEAESDSESALEREANEIAELQTSLIARREKKRKAQQEAEDAAAAERDPATAAYLEEEQERHTDSEDSSRHRDTSTGRARNRTRKDIPRECDWATLTGGDTVDGFLHEERNKDRSRSSSFEDNRSVKTPGRTSEEGNASADQITDRSRSRDQTTVSRKRKKPIQT